MSFSSQVKQELLDQPFEKDCCRQAFAYGLLLFSKYFGISNMRMKSEHAGVAEAYTDAVRHLAGQAPEQSVSKAGTYSVVVSDPEMRRAVLHAFGLDGTELKLRINRANLADECCSACFLRGAFLACGTVTSPEKEYHFEFSVDYMNLCGDLIKFLQEMGFDAGQAIRKNSCIAYLKGSEKIEDILTLMGAQNAALELMGTKVYKDIRNKVNRITNCESANIDRSVAAGAAQIEAIQKIEREMGFESLPDDLQELAQLRLENPEMSLRELSESLEEPITRSGVNHRLKRLQKIAEEIE